MSGASGCGPGEGSVGVAALPARPPTFEVQFANDDPSPLSSRASVPGSVVQLSGEAAAASDGLAAQLRWPGHPEFGPADYSGVDSRTEITIVRNLGYGTYRSRLAFGRCEPSEQVVHAMLGFYNDGADRNANGLRDDVEIDFQVLCGDPSLAYLTVFTDYEVSPEGDELFRKLARVVDLATGRYYETPADDRDDFVLAGTDPALRLDGWFAPNQFYELGFEWHAGILRFFVVLDSDPTERTLWTLADSSHVPEPPVQVIYNLWHPDSLWFPRDGDADFPQRDLTMQIDWFRYWAE
ncbi:MAG TPA: hypothetical protein VFQ61_04250 [Polyangiaceae bacterium]|nr:hypothetical protein [Polyangiaceae bacterium]